MRNLFALAMVAIIAAGCNTSYEKSPSGIRYKVFKGKGGETFKPGDFVKYNQVVLIPERDTVLSTTWGRMPAYARIDTGEMVRHTIYELFPQFAVGDSVIAVISVDSLKNRGMIRDYDHIFRRGGQITFRMKFLKRYTDEKEFEAEYEKDAMAEKDRRMKEAEQNAQVEIKSLEEHFSKNNIKVLRTPSGAFVEISQPGTGKTGDSTSYAMVFYTGTLFKGGETFDSNVGAQPARFNLGAGEVIPGFDEGLMFFNKGSKGRIYIPSNLAYGLQGRPPAIPPSATLVFDVEVTDIQPRPASTSPFGVPAPDDDHAGHDH